MLFYVESQSWVSSRDTKVFIFQISRTYDTDFDADLWKESSFFARKVTRYLCISRHESIVDYVLENLVIINDKELPPEGYGSIPKTTDTGNRSGFNSRIFRARIYLIVQLSTSNDPSKIFVAWEVQFISFLYLWVIQLEDFSAPLEYFINFKNRNIFACMLWSITFFYTIYKIIDFTPFLFIKSPLNGENISPVCPLSCF